MKRKTWEKLMNTRITLELPGEGKVTATIATWNTFSLAFGVSAESNLLQGYNSIAQDYRMKAHFIHEALAQRGVYSTPLD